MAARTAATRSRKRSPRSSTAVAITSPCTVPAEAAGPLLIDAVFDAARERNARCSPSRWPRQSSEQTTADSARDGPPRGGLYLAQTQAFERSWLRRAYAERLASAVTVTDDCHSSRRLGHRARRAGLDAQYQRSCRHLISSSQLRDLTPAQQPPTKSRHDTRSR